jgi:hypothetical protein
MVGSRDVGLVESMHEKAALVVDGQTEGSPRRDHSMRPKKMLGFVEQGRKNIAVIDRIDKAEEATAVGEFLLVRRRDCGDDPADGFAVTKCDERLNQILSQEWREPPTEDGADFSLERLYPVRIDRLGAPCCCDEGRDAGAVIDRNDT